MPENLDINNAFYKRRSSITVRIKEEHHIAQARRAAVAMSETAGFKQADVYSIATSVSELANNMFFHTIYGGMITCSEIGENGRSGIEIICTDEGPGIFDIDLAMQDGYSTSGGLGGGLPGVKRLMDEFDIYSKPGKGTRITVKKWKKQ